MDMSLLTNLVAGLIIVIGYYSPIAREPLMAIGTYALSGAFTNWLAIYMLFEKVPGCYGSGVIPLRFEDFKQGIRAMIMEQFFSAANIDRFFQQRSPNEVLIRLDPLVELLDYDLIFDRLVKAILESPFGSMLGMLGGEKVLQSLKPTFTRKMKDAMVDMAEDPAFKTAVHDHFTEALRGSGIAEKVEQIIQQRLDELTPQAVKEIVEKMIKKHLGWLVVWGGLFGGLIGLLASLFS